MTTPPSRRSAAHLPLHRGGFGAVQQRKHSLTKHEPVRWTVAFCIVQKKMTGSLHGYTLTRVFCLTRKNFFILLRNLARRILRQCVPAATGLHGYTLTRVFCLTRKKFFHTAEELSKTHHSGRVHFLFSAQETNQRRRLGGGVDRKVFRHYLSLPTLLPRL